MIILTAEEYFHICQVVRGKSGLDLGVGKEYLIIARLTPLLEKRNIASFAMLVELIKANKTPALSTEVVEALATHESLFFRDQAPFEYLKNEIVKELTGSRQSQSPLRVWSAACSFGQESYSLLMTLDSISNLPAFQFEITATDFSQQAIQRARLGAYTNFEVQRGLTPTMLTKYFQKKENGWQVKDYYRSKIKFEIHNFLESFRGLGQFDIIFCRNVLIYFNKETRREIFDKLCSSLKNDGYLILGGAETTQSFSDRFERIQRFKTPIFRKKNNLGL